MNISLIAVILSIVALAMSLSQPTYNFLMTMNQPESGEPSFNLYISYVYYTFTRINLTNNGTATAHDVKVQLIYSAPALVNWEATEFLSEINKSESTVMEIPIGYYQLNSTVPRGEWFTNVTSYEATVHVTCRELETTTSFSFQYLIA
jgi:hypothetical protein